MRKDTFCSNVLSLMAYYDLTGSDSVGKYTMKKANEVIAPVLDTLSSISGREHIKDFCCQ